MFLVKPVVLNLQYAQNLHFAKLVNYLQMIVHQEPAFTAYTRGMDKWIDLIMKYTMNFQTSTRVQTELTKITEQLGIAKKPIVAPEIFAQYGLFDAEVTAYLNEPMVVEALSQLADELHRDMQTFIGRKTFEITKVLKPVEVEGLGPCDAGFPIYIERSLPMALALKVHTHMELEQVGAVKIPKTLRAKVVPAINMKFEMNMGVISPFTQEIIGTGLTLGGHLTTPLEMIVSRTTNQVSLDIKIPEEVQRETPMFHAFVTPFTFKKNLRLLAPISKATSLKPILSGVPLKRFNMNIGAPLEIDARVIAESDAKYTDLYSYLEKIRQHNPISFVHTAILPSTIRRSSFRVVFNPVHSRTKAVSVTVGIIAKPTNQVPTTEEMASFCSKAVPQATCQENLLKTMSSLGNQASTLALRLDAKLVGTTKALSTAITFGYKLESTTIKDILKLVTHIELLAPFIPAYEVKMASSAEIPRVNILRNKEQLLQQALEVVLNGQVEFGRVNEAKEVIKMKTLMIKTEELKEAVRTSPEFLRCTQEEQLEHPLAEVCEFVRHQAASIDEVRTEMVIPAFLRRLPILDFIVPNVANVVKTLFIGHLIETPINHVSPTDLKVITKVNRVGDEAQLIIEYNGRRYEVRNIRLPTLLKGVFPISLRTPFLFVGLNRLTKLPATCHVAPTHVRTFDHKTYNYEMNNCFHLLFGDITEKIPVAVMARNLQRVSKEVKILAGVAEVLMTPISATNMKIQLNLNGQQQIIEVLPGDVKVIRHNGLEILHVKRFEDNHYAVHAVQEHVMVIFCGKHAQIFGNPLLRGRSCGLCGDFNAEITADLKTPERCIMSRPRFAAYSYMIQDSCQGIPSQDLAKYQQEKTKCVKQEIIPTTL